MDAHRACIADVSQALECGAFAQGERFDNVQVLYIVSKGRGAGLTTVGSPVTGWLGRSFGKGGAIQRCSAVESCSASVANSVFLISSVSDQNPACCCNVKHQCLLLHFGHIYNSLDVQ